MKSTEEMFTYYEIIEDISGSDEVVNKTVRLPRSTVKMLNLLVEDISKHKAVSRTGLMGEFITTCAKELMVRRGLMTPENQMSFMDLDLKSNLEGQECRS